MKKIIFAFLVLFALLLVGCKVDQPADDNNDDPNINDDDNNQNQDDDNNQNQDDTSNELDDTFNSVKEWVDSEIPYFITEDIELPYELDGIDATIDWYSSNPDAIDETGCVSINKLKAQTAILTYAVTVGFEQKEGTVEVVVTPALPEKVVERFEKQFSILITRDYEVEDVFYDLFEVDWYSTNTDVFDNEGIYTKPVDDLEFSIKYVVKCGEFSLEEKEIKLTAAGHSDVEKLDEIETWLKANALSDLYITEGVTFPNKYEKYNATITWESTNPYVISNEGVITHYVFERYVSLLCKYELENGSVGNLKYECIVSPLDTSKMSETEILENFLSAIALPQYEGVSFGYSACPKLSTTYGGLYFYTNTDAEIVEMLIPEGTSNRCGLYLDAQLLVIHDTANYNASAYANAAYVQSGYSGSSTGWHYTVGNDGIYRTLPENEIGFHANGSSNTPLTWIDTNIKATAKKPQITIGSDYYIYVNNQKTSVILPDTTRKFCDDGVLCEIGANGNYFIAKPWYCSSHGFNANQGGNASGIGIESAVKKGDDYLLTIKILSKLSAEILLRNELTLNRMVQHNTTSGKNCPQAIREANYWYTFKDFVSLEMYAKQYLDEYQFAWTSGSSILDENGQIALDLNGATDVKYSVVVSKGGQEVVSKSYTTILG